MLDVQPTAGHRVLMQSYPGRLVAMDKLSQNRSSTVWFSLASAVVCHCMFPTSLILHDIVSAAHQALERGQPLAKQLPLPGRTGTFAQASSSGNQPDRTDQA
jgi:hypothetical protein